MGITGYYTHRDCRLHKMGDNHPECPERLDAIEDRRFLLFDVRIRSPEGGTGED